MPFNVEEIKEEDFLIDPTEQDGIETETTNTEDTQEPTLPTKQPAKPNKENTEEPTEDATDSPFLEEEEETEVVEEEDKPEVKKEVKKVEKKTEVKLDEVINFNAYAESLIESGIWFPLTDSEGKVIPTEELGLDEKSFLELQTKQAEWIAEDKLKDREQEYGEQYQELVNHLKNKGNIQDLLATYQEQKDIEDLDTSDLDQAEEVLRFYGESVNWDKEEIKDFIDQAKDKGEDYLKSLAEKRKANLVDAVKENKEQIKQEAAYNEKQRQILADKFNKQLKESIYKDEIPEREKKALEKFFFEYKHPLENGKASDFYMKLEEIRQDPSKYYKFIKFVKDFENFENKKVVEDKVKSTIFRQYQTGNTIKKSDTMSPDRVEDKEKTKKEAPKTFKRMFNA